MSKPSAGSQAMTEEGWKSLRTTVLELFTPGAPIDELELFAGRKSQIQQLQDAAISKGRHAIIFGERGVGKTSIAKIFSLELNKPTRPIKIIYVQCSTTDTYDTLWRKILKRMKITVDGQESWGDELIQKRADPDQVEVILSNFPLHDLPIIIIDEYERMKSHPARTAMAETIKLLSNVPSIATLVIVGVGDSVIELIQEHESLARALEQVRMPRMTMEELREVVTKRLGKTPLRIGDDALWRIAFLSSGLPFYAHALGQAACLAAIEKKTFRITEEQVMQAIPSCFKMLDQSLIDAYTKATVQTRKGNMFKEVLAACSLADQDDLGRFSAASIEAPLGEILGKETKTPSFSFHLNELCDQERGAILAKTGDKGLFRFRFSEPIMQPYIMLRSISDGIISAETADKFAAKRQRQLSI